MLHLSQRTLLADGTSVVDVELAAEEILKHGELPDYVRVFPCRDAEEYEFRYGAEITGAEEDPEVVAASAVPYTPQDYMDLYDHLIGYNRNNNPTDAHVARIDEEMSFFEGEDHLDLLLSIKTLIDTFKSDGIVWGVGRGSSCASYVLYLLEVHDVDPISYEIQFSEFSKQ